MLTHSPLHAQRRSYSVGRESDAFYIDFAEEHRITLCKLHLRLSPLITTLSGIQTKTIRS